MTTSSTPQTQPLTERPAWKTLAAHHRQIRNLHLRQLFAGDLPGKAVRAQDAVVLAQIHIHPKPALDGALASVWCRAHAQAPRMVFAASIVQRQQRGKK